MHYHIIGMVYMKNVLRLLREGCNLLRRSLLFYHKSELLINHGKSYKRN